MHLEVFYIPVKPTKMTKITVSLPVRWVEQLHEIGEPQRMPLSMMVRIAVATYLTEHKHTPHPVMPPKDR